MNGLPKKFAKLGFKKGWALFRKSRGRASAPGKPKKVRRHKRAKKTGTPARNPSNGGVVMAKKRGRKRAAVKRAAHRVARRIGAGMDTKPGKVLMAAGVAAAGGIATSYALNHIPKVKDMSQTVKSGAQVAAGIAAILFGKKKWIKGLGAGAVIAGVFGVSKSVLKLDPMAGPGAGLSKLPPEVMKRLINSGKMGIPASIRMGLPASIRMGGPLSTPVRSSGWGGVSM